MPIEAAMIYSNIGRSYCQLATVQERELNISQAIHVLNDALTIRNEVQYPFEYAVTTSILGDAYSILAEVKEPDKNYKKAISTYNKAIKIFIKKHEEFYENLVKKKEEVELNLKSLQT
ncbi:MAG: hypothetical protein ACTSQE_10685 [Candidatus Heimdallarchaeaceae archaeon]